MIYLFENKFKVAMYALMAIFFVLVLLLAPGVACFIAAGGILIFLARRIKYSGVGAAIAWYVAGTLLYAGIFILFAIGASAASFRGGGPSEIVDYTILFFVVLWQVVAFVCAIRRNSDVAKLVIASLSALIIGVIACLFVVKLWVQQNTSQF